MPSPLPAKVKQKRAEGGGFQAALAQAEAQRQVHQRRYLDMTPLHTLPFSRTHKIRYLTWHQVVHRRAVVDAEEAGLEGPK